MFVWSVVLLIILVYLYNRNKNVKGLCNFLPGPPGYPFIGNGLQLSAGGSQDFFATIAGYWKDYGSRFRIFIGEHLVVLIADPKDVEVVLSRQDLIEKSDEYNFIKPWLGTGLLTSVGEKWKKHRRVITPAFHFKILENFIQVFDNQGDVFIKKLKSHVGKGPFDIHAYITLCALDIICESAMGVSVKAQEDSESTYVKAVKDACSVINNRARNPMKRPEALFRLSSDYRLQKKSLEILHGYTESTIKQRKKILQSLNESFSSYTEESDIYGSKKKMAFLDLLLLSTVDGKPMSDLDIREEVDTFLFEGHDTVSSAIGFIVYELSKNIDVQDKLFKEVMEIFSDDLTRPITHSDLNNMKYLELVIKEALRLHPSVPFIARNVSKNVNINGMEIPAHASILILCYNMNRNPEIFPDPEKFIPERFLPEETNKRHPFSCVFFSAGPRNCIGQKFAMLEMKSTVSKLVRNYVIESTNQSLLLSGDLILKSVNGINSHNAVSSAIGFAVYELANNVEVQDKLFKEQVEIFPDDITRSATHGYMIYGEFNACSRPPEEIRNSITGSFFAYSITNLDLLMSVVFFIRYEKKSAALIFKTCLIIFRDDIYCINISKKHVIKSTIQSLLLDFILNSLTESK